jgi:hypothetical protein
LPFTFHFPLYPFYYSFTLPFSLLVVKSERGFGGCAKGVKRGGKGCENGRKKSSGKSMGSSGSDKNDSAFNNGITLHVGMCG